MKALRVFCSQTCKSSHCVECMFVDRTGILAQIEQRLLKGAQHCGFETGEQQRADFLDAGEMAARLTVVGKEDDHRQSAHVRGAGRMQSNCPLNLRITHAKVASGDQRPDWGMEDYRGERLSHLTNQRVISVLDQLKQERLGLVPRDVVQQRSNAGLLLGYSPETGKSHCQRLHAEHVLQSFFRNTPGDEVDQVGSLLRYH